MRSSELKAIYARIAIFSVLSLVGVLSAVAYKFIFDDWSFAEVSFGMTVVAMLASCVLGFLEAALFEVFLGYAKQDAAIATRDRGGWGPIARFVFPALAVALLPFSLLLGFGTAMKLIDWWG